MDVKQFSSSLNSLCVDAPNLRNIFIDVDLNLKQISLKDWQDILRKLSYILLDSKHTIKIAHHFNAWILEILGSCKEYIVCCSSKNEFDSHAHRAFTVCLSKILTKETMKFVLNYFETAPSPFEFLDHEKDDPTPKRRKLEQFIPNVEELDLLEAFYTLLLKLGPEFANLWELSHVLKHLENSDEAVRWYTCSSLSLILQMNEEETTKLIQKYVSSTFHENMVVSRASQSSLAKNLTRLNLTFDSSPKNDLTIFNFSCKIGRITLPLYSKQFANAHHDSLIEVPSMMHNLEAISLGVSSSRPVLVEGMVGCGKTSIVKHLAGITGRIQAPALTKVQLSEQTDSKTLIGTYRCTANPGEFIWQSGALTQAVTAGHWLLLEDIDFAPLDAVSLLIPLLESRTLSVPGQGTIRAHPNFQVFTTRRIFPAGCKGRIGSSNLLEKLWIKVSLQPLTAKELKTIICAKWPVLVDISDKLVEVFLALSYGQHEADRVEVKCEQCSSPDLLPSKTSGRFVSVRDMMKWCSRMVHHVDKENLHVRAFQEAIECFCSAVPKESVRYSLAMHIGSHLNISQPLVDHYLYVYSPEVSIKPSMFIVGTRARVPRLKFSHVSFSASELQSTFSKTRLFSYLLERVAVAAMMSEPVLIVGETGTGKTSTVQHLARQTNHSLVVINMNQQSDSADLLGGFKPVEVRTLVSPLRSEFERLFGTTFSTKQNVKFLSHIMTTYANERWTDLFTLMQHSITRARDKLLTEKKAFMNDVADSQLVEMVSKKRSLKEVKNLLKRWKSLQDLLKTVQDQIQRVKSSLAFSFIEGALVKAVQKGDWVLLDEINLANADTLECLSGLLESSKGSLTLLERGDSEPIERNSEFRLFACMNPATDIGKKELPAGLRNRFTEFFMEEPKENDLKQIVRDYLQKFNPSPVQINGIVKFYQKVKQKSSTELMDGTGHKPHFSLRTLCRALLVVQNNSFRNIKRSLYEAFCLSFLTQLDHSSYQKVTHWIQKDVVGSKIPSGPQPPPGDSENFVLVEQFWIPKGNSDPCAAEDYIVTESVRKNLTDVVRIVSLGRFPILIQGDTSVGKTSLISYLAKRTGNTCVRINNHQHTDLQEYVGSYAPDESGKLVFKEGVLVNAMRKGHWLILDELNLAPTDVLEALNRLLDENRELFIPEIETTVQAHPKFMLFATQNPSGLYGGRQVLSRAFKNRFVELHFDRIPNNELELILHKRCKVSPSLAKRMVNVLHDLQTRRRESNLFQGKQSFVTLRDLFRWAERYRLAPAVKGFYDWDQHIADEGFLVLAGKIRSENETQVIKEVLKKHLNRDVKSENLFTLSENTSTVTRSTLDSLRKIDWFDHVVWTNDMRRLFVLLSKALSFCEPVLLVGETGCGKTTVCQMISSITSRTLFTVNCHMHTEGADFLGGLRPVRERTSENDDRLFEWVDGPLIESMREGGLFLADEISLADDSVLERLNSVLEPERTLTLSEKGSTTFEGQSDVEILVAHEAFRLVGTMNPGGDFGKKELSPALRNRLTEIWCPKLDIKRSSSDVKLIIEHNLNASVNKEISDLMLNFLNIFSQTDLGKKLTISIRDILSWVAFMNIATSCSFREIDLALAYVHGACLVILDGLGSGTSANAVQNWHKLKESSLKFLCLQTQRFTGMSLEVHRFRRVSQGSFCDNDRLFGIEPFFIPKGSSESTSGEMFSFEAPKTSMNLLRLIRGLQLPRPILLEGSPGVGKTSLVTALAKASCNKIVRINLSEQTDVSDLFGADLPVEGSEGGHFSWRDGPLLQALKKGAWVVLDELNLASQSVLEGLNACFDHRGEVYVPELNKTFKVKHSSTKIFACQNPLYQGGARKGLPKSFLNRFTQVYVEPLSAEDLLFILKMVHPDLPSELLLKMVEFNCHLVTKVVTERKFGSRGGPWELNLRDLFRWCEIMKKHHSLKELNPGDFVELIYADRMRLREDKESVLKAYKRVFQQDLYPLNKKSGLFFINEKFVQFGNARIARKQLGQGSCAKSSLELFLTHNQTPYIESIVHCINMNWMTLLVGSSCEGKTSLIRLLAALVGETVNVLSVNSHMDVTELLGGFEQADFGRTLSELCDELKKVIWEVIRVDLLSCDQSLNRSSEYFKLWKNLQKSREKIDGLTTSEEVDHFIKICRNMLSIIVRVKKETSDKALVKRLKKLQKSCSILRQKVTECNTLSGGGTFEWVDSPLVKAVKNGHWLLIDGVNLCSPSVLDRLNGLLEPGGVLTMSERGVIDGKVPTITPHPRFRLFLAMNPLQGEISRAMRNRGVEICMIDMWQHQEDLIALLLSQGIEDFDLQKALINCHFDICASLPGYERPDISCLSQAGLMTKRLLQHGLALIDAVDLSLHLVYVKNYGKPNIKYNIEKIIKSTLDNLPGSNSISTEIEISSSYSSMFVDVEKLRFSSLCFPEQLSSLLRISLRKVTPESLSLNSDISSLFPNRYLMSKWKNILVGVFVSLQSLSIDHWLMFKKYFSEVCSDDAIVKAVGQVVELSSCLQTYLPDVLDKNLSVDPRLSSVFQNYDVNVVSGANKMLLRIWLSLIDAFDQKTSTLATGKAINKRKRNKKSGLTVLELSRNISLGFTSEQMVLHPCLRYIYSFFQAVHEFLSDLSKDCSIVLPDGQYFELMTAVEWKRRFKVLCEKTFSKESFHVLLPELAYHWQLIQDHLIEKILEPQFSLLVPPALLDAIQNVTMSFRSHCSPLHAVIPELRNGLGYPLPFTEEAYFTICDKLCSVSSSLRPRLKSRDDIYKALILASEEGIRVKSNFVKLAFEVAGNIRNNFDGDLNKYWKLIGDLDQSVLPISASESYRQSSSTYNLQLWPIIDYFACLKLLNTNSNDLQNDWNLNLHSDLLLKSSDLPLALVFSEVSVSSSAVCLYLINTSNSSVVRPSSWFTFDLVRWEELTENEDFSQYWPGEDTFILSPMGCLLSYHLLVGLCRFDEDSTFMSVGNHSERERQLSQMQVTLRQNFNFLSNPSCSYSSCLTRTVESFLDNLCSSLNDVFKLNLADGSTSCSMSFEVLNKMNLNAKDLLGPEGVTILKNLVDVTGRIALAKDIYDVAHLGVLSGLLQTWLLSHTEPLDPAKQRNLLLSYGKEELRQNRDFVLMFKWMKALKYSQTGKDIHPHTSYYKKRVTALKDEIENLSMKVAYRPQPPQYIDIVNDVNHFITSIFLPSRIVGLLSILNGNQDIEVTLKQCESTLLSCDQFIRKMTSTYPLYRDLIYPLLHGVTISCQGIRTLMVLSKNKRLSSFIPKNNPENLLSSFDNMIYSVLEFPRMRDCAYPTQALLKIMNDQNSIANYISDDSGYLNKVNSLSLRASSYDLYNYVSTTSYLDKETFFILKEIVEKVINWWLDNESQNKKEAEEKDALFKYKPRTLAISETEEEEMEREFLELFPDFADEFKNIEDMSEVSSEDGEAPVENPETILPGLSEEHFEEILEVHKSLMTHFTETFWKFCDKNCQKIIEVPVTLRTQLIRLLLKVVGPYGTHSVDEAAISSFLVSNHVSREAALNSVKSSVIQKSPNYYHDAAPDQAMKIRPLLEDLCVKINELLTHWPSHPSLVMIKKVINRVLGFSVSSPLIRLVVGLETVLEKSHEWEKNAHRGVSLINELTPITEQVIEWRKMELKAWQSCLDMVTEKVNLQANKYWPHLYQTLLSVSQSDLMEIVLTLKQFLESSLIGDFERRLQFVSTMHCHLCFERKFLNDENSSVETLDNLISVSWNVYKYFSQFLPQVIDNLRTSRKPIEKDIKDYVKIAKWNDINFFSVRDSVIKSRRTLHRHMKKWENVLKQPVSPLLVDGVSEINSPKGDWDKKDSLRLSLPFIPPSLPVDPVSNYGIENSLMNRIQPLSKKCFQFIKDILNGHSYQDNSVAVEDLTEEIISGYQEIIIACGKAENISEKEERLRKLKDIMNRKKNNLATLFKSLYHRGVSYTKGTSLWKEHDLNKCFTVPPFDPSVAYNKLKLDPALKPFWEASDKYFFKSIARFTLLSNSLSQAHNDLGPEDIRRLSGFSSHLLLLCRDLRNALPEFSETTMSISSLTEEICNATRSYVPCHEEFTAWQKNLHCIVIGMSLVIDEESILLDSLVSDDVPLFEFDPSNNIKITDLQKTAVQIKELQPCFRELLVDWPDCKFSSENALYKTICSLSNIHLLKCNVSKITSIVDKLHISLQILNKNLVPLNPLTKALVFWVEKWRRASDEFKNWLSAVKPIVFPSYEHSPEIEHLICVLLKATEDIYKHHCLEKIEINENDTGEESTKNLITKSIVRSLLSDIRCTKVVEVNKMLRNLIYEINHACRFTLIYGLKSVLPLLQVYLALCQNILSSTVDNYRSLCKLNSVLLGIFHQLAVKGFCKPQELEEQAGDGEGATQFQDSGPGMSEGDGQKDVSDRFESEDQLESALQKGEKEPEGDKDLKEDDGIEMSQDFEGTMQDIDKTESGENEEDKDNEEEEELDKQMGETGKDADKLDEKLWGNDDKEDEETEKGKEDLEDGPGDGETTESEIVAKEDNKSKEERENPKENRNKLDTMDEDRREPEEEIEETTYEDDFADKQGGEDQTDRNDEQEEEQMELPDDLNLDGNEADGDEEGEDASDLPVEVEEKELFPEDQKDPKDQANEEPMDVDEQKDAEAENNPSEDHTDEKETDQESEDFRRDDKRTGTNEGDETETQEDSTDPEERALPSKDDATSKENAEDAPTDSTEASQDKTKEQPKASLGFQTPDEEFDQEEHGEMGEQADETTGTGQSDSKTRDESHQAEISSLAAADSSKDKTDNFEQKKKPRNDDSQSKTLGEIKQDLKRGLLTKDSGKRDDLQPKEVNENEEQENKDKIGPESDLYEHIASAKEQNDAQMVDAASQDEAKLRPAPLEEEQKGEEKEMEGITDALTQTEEAVEETKEDERKRKTSESEGDGPSRKRFRDPMQESLSTENDDTFEIEGEALTEMIVQRPVTNTIETKLDENEDEKLVSAFSEDLFSTRERIEECDANADNEVGSNLWSNLEGQVSPLALELCEQLRLILEPTEASKLKGDFRTGKRLNMRKIIPYIASQFRKDKIWLRRSQPSKRSYQVLLAVDDSESMQEVKAGDLARKSVALVAKALTQLEVGQVGVLSFGATTKILHPMDRPFTDAAGAGVFSHLDFQQPKSDFARMLEDATALLTTAKGNSQTNTSTSQLLLIISDGQTHARSKAVKTAVRAARESGVFVVFFVLDDKSNEYSFYDSLVFEDGELRPMVDSFPFPFFVVVRDLDSLPDALANALRQWFELVSAQSR